MMRHTNVWEQLWEQLRESTEGPTVTLQVPRDVADQLLSMLATSLEVDDGGMGDMDDDDFGGMPDGDGDDGLGMPPLGDDDGDDMFAGLGDDSDGDSDDEDDGPPPKKKKGASDDPDDDEDDDDDEDEETDEAMDYAHSGGDPSGLRPQTAFGESYRGPARKQRGVRRSRW